MVKMFLMTGADIHMRNNGGNTALHAAFKVNNENILGMLIDRGANYKVINDNGETPLFYAKPETARKYGLYNEPILM